MSTITQHKTKSLHEIEMFVCGNVQLQLEGKDVAIPFLQGAPGCGKTASVKEWCRKYDWNLMSVHFALKPIEEISGLPLQVKITINDKEFDGTEWTYPEILTQMYNLDQSKPTILFLDDFHLCSPDHLNLGFEMFTNRAIRGYHMPANSAFILAGNSSSKAGTKAGNSAIINRCCILPIAMDYKYWKDKFAMPHSVNFKIISFLSNDKYQKYFHMEEMTNKPWASPRSWTRLSEILNPLEQAMRNNIPYQDLIYYCESHIGEEASSEFASYYKLYLETEMDKVFNGTKKIEIPNDMSGQYIYMLSTVGEFFNRYQSTNKETSDNAYNKLSEITMLMANKSLSIATVGAKELVEFLKIAEYQRFKSGIKKIDENTAFKITNEVNMI